MGYCENAGEKPQSMCSLTMSLALAHVKEPFYSLWFNPFGDVIFSNLWSCTILGSVLAM
jgi:hypothetical protein